MPNIDISGNPIDLGNLTSIDYSVIFEYGPSGFTGSISANGIGSPIPISQAEFITIFKDRSNGSQMLSALEAHVESAIRTELG